MRLKFIGMICPDCGEISDIDEYYGPQPRIRKHSGWSGYYYTVSVCCGNYLILFDEQKRFIDVVAIGGHMDPSWVLAGAGERQIEDDEIDF